MSLDIQQRCLQTKKLTFSDELSVWVEENPTRAKVIKIAAFIFGALLVAASLLLFTFPSVASIVGLTTSVIIMISSLAFSCVNLLPDKIEATASPIPDPTSLFTSSQPYPLLPTETPRVPQPASCGTVDQRTVLPALQIASMLESDAALDLSSGLQSVGSYSPPICQRGSLLDPL